MNKYIVIAVAACVAVAALLMGRHLHLRPSQVSVAPQSGAQQAAKESPHGPNPFGSVPGPGEQSSAPAISAKPASRETEASREFFAPTTNLISFVTNARSSPSAASYFYATMAIRECDQYMYAMVSLKAELPSMSAKRRATVETNTLRCSEVEKLEGKLLRKLGDEGVAAGDAGFAAMTPLTSKVSSAAEAAGGQQQRKMIEGMYATQDAGVMWAVAHELAMSSDALSVSGRRMTEIERSSLPAAVMLASCEFGAPCDASNPLVRWQCLASDLCDVTGLNALFKQSGTDFWASYTEGSRFDHQVALKLRDEIVSGIARGDRRVLTYRPPSS